MKTENAKTIDSEFMNFFLRIGRIFGGHGNQMDVAAILYIEPKEVAMEELAARTGYSLASISNTMKALEGLGMVRRVKKPKTKKVFFYMEKNIFAQNIKKFSAFRDYGLKLAINEVPKIITHYKNSKNVEIKKKVEILTDYVAQMVKFEKVMDNFLNELKSLSAKV